jgi:hypothetical protein
MESILRGAMGRISGYQRVRLHSTSDVAIAGHAAEGVMHALAELLDNAANFSPLTAEVHVYVEEVPAGIVITIEDSGLVMSDVQLRRAERAVTSDETGLASVHGSRLGLSVVGRLARKHGLTVSFRPSARGGTGALMMLPQDVLTRVGADGSPAHTRATAPTRAPVRPSGVTAAPLPPEASEPPASGPAQDTPAESLPEPAEPLTEPRPEPSAELSEPSGDATAEVPELGESGLPKRRRGRTLAAARRRTGEAEKSKSDKSRTTTASATDTTTQALRFSDFRKAVRTTSPHPANSTDPEGTTT